MTSEKNKQIDISIVIPLYRGQKYCERLLEMIQTNCRHQDLYRRCNVEVIFVNDYPEEKIVIKDGEYDFAFYVIEQEKNTGIHRARVSGIRQAQGEYIVLFDQDDLMTDDYLYLQREKCMAKNADFCVCNGWASRFRVLQSKEVLANKINRIEYYLETGNAIASPGQVMMKRECVPEEWLSNVQQCNGADDYLLWVMVLKKGYSFVVNNEYLYYHTPERTADSIDDSKMIESIEESVRILNRTGYLSKEDVAIVEKQITERVYRNKAYRLSETVDSLDKYMTPKSGIKFRNMFFAMYQWMKLKNQGTSICEYLYDRGYTKVAIHGMGYIGECLYQELCDSNVQVVFAIDRTALDFKQELPIVSIEDKFDRVDLVISTVAEGITESINILEEKGQCRVVMLAELLAEMSA